MAKNDTNIPRGVTLDTSDSDNTANFLPAYYRSDSNKKFLHATINQLTQPGVVKKVNGYIGRLSAKSTSSSDIFINAPSKNRQNYQLEPAMVINDDMDNTVFLKDYLDYVNQLRAFGANVSNHPRLNSQEVYSWNPHINWDKFVNFQNYYWMPNGPDVVTISNPMLAVDSKFTVDLEVIKGDAAFILTPDGLTRNPTITLYRGYTYQFDVNSPNHPFSIKTIKSIGISNRYNTVSNNGITSGTVTFEVLDNAPDILYYVSENDVNAGGVISILDDTDHSYINVEHEIIGKKTYALSSGINLSNGMCVTFRGTVVPAKYATGKFHVTGVGDAIKLIADNDLQLISTYTTSQSIQFEVNPFDVSPFDTATSYASKIDYMVIDLGSNDKNPWSRYNKWIHKSVIEDSAAINKVSPNLDQNYRAVRPIIEFDTNLKLFNFGTFAEVDVDLIDTYTTDVFSNIEGSLGYSVDNIPLSSGQRVIFTADPDPLVTNNIYRVEFIDVLHEINSKKISSSGTITNLQKVESDWTAIITGLDSTEGVVVGSTLTATSKTGKLYNSTIDTEVQVIEVISLTSLKYVVKGGIKPVLGTISNIKITRDSSRQLRLIKESSPVIDQVVAVKHGRISQGLMYWFNGITWKLAQQKTDVNQPPLFDVVDDNGISFGDTSEYSGSTFKGTSIFSYKVGTTGTNDTNLGFPLSYKNINNIGDIVFNFTLINDTFQYETSNVTQTKTIDTGFLISTHNNITSYENGWVTCTCQYTQPAVRVYRNSNKTNNFDIDIFDNLPSLSDIEVRIYVNGIRSLTTNTWTIKSTLDDGSPLLYHQIVFTNPILLSDILTIKVFSLLPINVNGYYEIPINLQHNPLNGALTEFTLGEVVDHVDSIVDNIYLGQQNYQFTGTYPGISNLRDLVNLSQFGTKFVQHSGPLSLSMYHVTSDNNLIRAIDKSRNDYCKFKRAFMNVASTLGVDTDTKRHVDLVLNALNADTPSTSPYYFSDMIPYGAYNKTDFIVRDPEVTIFSLSKVFTLDTLSTSAVLVYLNDVQLLHGSEYIFNTQGFVELLVRLTAKDEVSIYEYKNTDGCLIPETPTKLGMWPKYTPTIYRDTTLVTPRWVLQGHDGSLTLLYGYYNETTQELTLDYRDELSLELEKRIYNNIKVQYDSNIFDINDVIPRYGIPSDYSLQEFNEVLISNYYQWAVNIKQDFSTILTQDRTNFFLYNYSKHYTLDNQQSPGCWRGIYQWMYGTDRPHICPWEMLGITEEPVWWTEVYGPLPYTSNNIVMWSDISNGLVKDPTTPVVLSKFVKPFLLDHLPVNENGDLVSPYENNIVRGRLIDAQQGDFKFGDISPVEAAWRRSSYYPFSVIKTAMLLKPANTIGVLLDRSRISRNLTNQLVYTDTKKRINLSDIKVPSIYLSTNRIQTAGLINYLISYIDCADIANYNHYKSDLLSLTSQLCYRVSGFTSKEKFNLLLESRSPASTGNIFIPQEDYKVVMNTSSPISVLVYSGVIITKVEGGYEIKGYSITQPYFKYYSSSVSGSHITIGGVSAAYSLWSANQYYLKDRYVKFNERYYNTNVSHVSTDFFEPNNFTLLSDLPVVGGERIEFKQRWDTEEQQLLYGSKLTSIQLVVDFLLGYGRWLSNQGFNFNEFNRALGAVANWETSAKEFVFWTTQNWGNNQPVWAEWTPNVPVQNGEIVRYTGDYYRALRTMTELTFTEDDYVLLPGLSVDGNSVLTLSPAATTLVFSTYLSVVDDITKSNYVYEMFDVNGNPILPQYVNSFRTDNAVSYTTKKDTYIYCASFYLVQQEHVIVINNTTMFNDTIYNPESGYKQDKIKVAGYVSADWNGSVNVPGFIIDNAIISEWTPWQDYALGDVVKHRTFYYSANESIPGTETFNNSNWIKLRNAPSAKLLPNWNYKATQFTDFYSLDSDNFDIAQQKMSQHLIGYQKRQYLENIIQDDVSEFKFYQGMIIEKGTQNVLNKLFDVLSSSNKESLTFYEEWAIRTGSYGASLAFNTVEFKLDESSFRSNPQGFQLLNTNDVVSNDYIIHVLPTEVYVKPLGYTPSIWPENTKQAQVLRPCGHVRESEVSLVVKSLSELLTSSTSLSVGQYVWCTFEGTSWNVYQLELAETTFKECHVTATTVRFVCDNTLTEGQYIKLIDTNSTPKPLYNNKFFKVVSVTSTEFSIALASGPSLSNEEVAKLHVNILVSRRYINKDDNNIPSSAALGELIWTDNYAGSDGQWITWEWKLAEWSVKHQAISHPDVTKIKQAFLYNKVSNQVVTYLDVVDSLYGKNPIIADREIKFKSFYDPAIYSIHTTTTVVNGVNVDADIAWNTEQVGTLWWDLRTAKFISSYAEDVAYRNSTWSTLAYGATIDVYEWVESKLLPESWDETADTDAGLANGISGKSLYGNLYYCQRRRYDKISQRYSYTYYFWVKNKITIPNVAGRNLSASNVASLIANPRGDGYAFLALTGTNSFSLVNVKPMLSHDDVVLSVEYWTNDKITQNIHSQWKLISANERTVLPASIEQKWFDSLCGYDMQHRNVPDNLLPVKLQYGIDNRPRQSMFINRCETLKQFIEQTNLVMLTYAMVDTRDLSDLFMYDPIPNSNRGLYDDDIDTDAELRLTVAKSYIKPVINPVIVNGKITGIDIINPGRGYLNAPYANVIGTGIGAVVRFTISNTGAINSCEIINSGEGYDDNTIITVRNYSVLVKSDLSSNSVWSIYDYDRTTEEWNKVLMQSYDTRKYWSYVDWYDVSYTQYTAVSHSVNTYSDLYDLDAAVGEVVNVRTTNSNRWVLLKKYKNVKSSDWTQSYKVIGSQNGTIQFSSLLYNFADTTIGYDGYFYDQGVYDNGAVIELRIILNLIKDKLFIDDLKSEYLQLFFTCVRAALSEQTYIDWIFKTSFVNVMHNVGALHQTVTYQNDNLSNFEDYVNEVKPYRTQVREYVSLYDATDTSNLLTTDFDVPAESTSFYKFKNGKITAASNAPYTTQSWYDNAGYSVVSIKVLNSGSGYISEPTVTVVSSTGHNATAKAYISSGKLSRITVVTAGSKYLSVPEIKIENGLASNGVAATAIAILGNGVVRSNLIKLKFDRINSNYAMSSLDCTDTFIGTRLVQFRLTWAPDIRVGYSSVTVNGLLQLRDTYTIKVDTITTANGYESYVGLITFDSAPNGNIVVTYIKDVSLMTAVDRIQFYYTPRPGNLGKDLAQLMTGIEYAGVVLSGVNVNSSVGWDSNPYYTESWDSFKPTIDDYQVTVAANTYNIELPYIPTIGSVLNVYYSFNYTKLLSTDGRTLTYYFSKYEHIPSVAVYKLAKVLTDANFNTNEIHLDSVDQIKIGDVVSNNIHPVTTTTLRLISTSSTYNYLTVNSTLVLYVNMPLFFTGKTSVGGLLLEHTYYVCEIISSTQFTISLTVSGSKVGVTDSLGAMTIVAGEFNYNTTIIDINTTTKVVTLSNMLSTLVAATTELKIKRQLVKYRDFLKISRTSITLKRAFPLGVKLELSGKREVVRIDDDNYGNTSIKNDHAIMSSYVADGVSKIVTIPSTYTNKSGEVVDFQINDGDMFIIRNSTSAGSESEYNIDTAISGGSFAEHSAAGIAASEIIIDGSSLINQDTDAGPEEVVPGQVVDALAIKVYDRTTEVDATAKYPTGSYMQFKDMLNRTHIKRLRADKQTQLTVALLLTDTTITVTDASTFDIPSPELNKPGVIDINGERIEFFTINGNVLGQLRRGTLGTGILAVHEVSASVQEIGTNETMPYQDNILITEVESDGSQYVDISVFPIKSSNWVLKTTMLAVTLLREDTSITVTDASSFKLEPNKPGVVTINGERIEFNEITGNILSQLKRGTKNTVILDTHDQNSIVYNNSTADYGQCNNIEVVIDGKLLKKVPYQIHDANINIASPLGDVQYNAEFSVNGKSKQIRLETAVPAGTIITVIKRVGTDWNETVKSNAVKIAITSFLNAMPGSQYPGNI